MSKNKTIFILQGTNRAIFFFFFFRDSQCLNISKGWEEQPCNLYIAPGPSDPACATPRLASLALAAAAKDKTLNL